MVDKIEQGNPQQSAHGILEQDFFCALKKPGRVVPSVIIQTIQLAGEGFVITFIGGDHFRQGAEAGRFVPAQTAVKTLAALAQLDATSLGENEQGDQFSSRTGSGVGTVVETVRSQCFEDSHKSRIFLLPPLDEELAVAELSSKRLRCHGRRFLSSCLILLPTPDLFLVKRTLDRSAGRKEPRQNGLGLLDFVLVDRVRQTRIAA